MTDFGDDYDPAMLPELSSSSGILSEYYDIWGNHRPNTPATQVALLTAMRVLRDGIVVQDPATAERPSMLPPVQVSNHRDAPVVTIFLSQVTPPPALRWTLHEESGVVHSGELPAAELHWNHDPGDDAKTCGRAEFRLTRLPPLGYHRLTLEALDGSQPLAEMSWIVTPQSCYQPPVLEEGQRVWGVAVQLYSLRSQRNWGIGDFTDLFNAVDMLAEWGAASIGLNPLHALYPSVPQRASPYSPSSRCFLNPLYLDVEALADFGECEKAQAVVGQAEFQARLQQLRATELVDYAAVAEQKLALLRLLFQHFSDTELVSEGQRGRAFRQFQGVSGETLQRHAVFESLHAYFQQTHAATAGADWPNWPEAYRHPESSTVRHYADQHRDDIEFYQYLQWQASLQLEAVVERAQQRGLALGLYRDVALGCDGGGSDVWAEQHWYAQGAHLGAPPDDFSPAGQDWGLPPLLPRSLADCAYRPFIAALRANMSLDGALRIDHVMSL